MDPQTREVLQALTDAIRALIRETRELGNRIELLATEVKTGVPGRQEAAGGR
jgi:hypothetical protein